MKSIIKALIIAIGIYFIDPFTDGMNIVFGINVFLLWQFISSGFNFTSMFCRMFNEKFKWLTIILCAIILTIGECKSFKPANDEYVSKVNELYGNRFIFTDTKYINNYSYIFIVCRKCHKKIRVKAGYFIDNGDKLYCPKCKYKSFN